MEYEPLIYTEQGVVYLFSRYWSEIRVLKNEIKEITDTHTHFPDFYYINKNGSECGLEFEYLLSKFGNHLSQLSTLKDEKIDFILVVYWEEDKDKIELINNLKEQGINSKFICLKDYFSPIVLRINGKLVCKWILDNKEMKFTEIYDYDSIKKSTKILLKNNIRILHKKRRLYRTIGWDITQSDNIEFSHWRYIHFYTTDTEFNESEIPSKLFVKPKSYKHIVGYFDIVCGIKIKKEDSLIKNYFTNYYFYPYVKRYNDSTCFLYKSFNILPFATGKRLYDILIQKNIRIDTPRSKKIYDLQLIKEIDAIIQV